MLRPTFFSLYAADAEIVTVMLRTPAASAISAPRAFGTSAHHVAPLAGSRSMTSAPPAIAGTAVGDTNDAASTWASPASASAIASSARAAAGTGDSDWSPSRGVTSRIVTIVV